MRRFAIFFPQFHQTKVNDEAWGVGFTDWSLVGSANAFRYWKRRAPACGFYDLSVEHDVRSRFIDASKAGLDGFGIYHYRFEDGPELTAVERYLSNALAPVPTDFGYFFIWANEDWSKRWAGKDTEILKVVPKSPSLEQIRDHVAYLKPFMLQKCYARVDDQPMFVFYRPDFFDDPSTTIATYRREFESVGISPKLGYFAKNTSESELSNMFDFCYLFEPRLYQNFQGIRGNRLVHRVSSILSKTIPYSYWEYISNMAVRFLKQDSNTSSFDKFLEYFESDIRRNFVKSFDCVVQNVLTCGWNNAPRYRERSNEIVQVPNRMQFTTLVSLATNDQTTSNSIPLLCNAWNEWSEGASIEPCVYLGNYLLNIYVEKN